MKKNVNKKSYVKIETTYPHNLLIHLSRLINNDISLMKDRDKFLDMYSKAYKNDYNEMQLLKLAYEKDIVKGFFKCLNEADWRKRVLVEKTVNALVKYLEEKYAVLLVESLMYVFGFDFKLKIDRKWETPVGERADFHEKMNHISKNVFEILDQIKTQEGNEKLELQIEKFLKVSEKSEVYNEGNIDLDIFEIENELSKDGERVGQDKFSNDKEEIYDQKSVAEENNIQSTKFYKLMSLQDRRTLKKAFQGNAVSQCKMGEYYSDKATNHLDFDESIKWYSLSANNGYVRATFALAKLYDQNSHEIPGGKEKAFKIYSDMANQSFPTAQCILGMKYWYGDGVKGDVHKAIEWLEKAAIQRHERAIRILADLYLSINDMKNARKWYEIGANAGDLYCKDKI